MQMWVHTCSSEEKLFNLSFAFISYSGYNVNSAHDITMRNEVENGMQQHNHSGNASSLNIGIKGVGRLLMNVYAHARPHRLAC